MRLRFRIKAVRFDDLLQLQIVDSTKHLIRVEGKPGKTCNRIE